MAFDFPSSPSIGQVYVTGTGTAYKWTGDVWNVDAALTPLPTSRRVLNYGGAGTYSYVKPSGLKELVVEIWGAGGGGGGTGATAAGQQAIGAGGGAGGYTRKLYKATELAASTPLVLGAGGVAGAAAAAGAGGKGVTSTFMGLTVTGGDGGPGGGGIGTISPSGNSAPGIGSGGDFNGKGDYATAGGAFLIANTYYLLSQGGANFGSSTPAGGWANAAGGPGNFNAAGWGGNGAFSGASQAARVGGAGGDAFAILTETYWDADYLGTAPLLSSMKVTVITAIGGGTYVKPAGLKYLKVEIQGPGGSGGGGQATGAGQYSVGGGGGAGAFGEKLYAAADLSASEPYVVGAGGTPQTGPGIQGVACTFKGMTVTGGYGGSTSGAGVYIVGAGAQGGVATGCDLVTVGATGQHGYGVVSATVLYGGAGGSSRFGGGGSPPIGSTAAGSAANGYGAGGSGASLTASMAALSSGAGSPGFIRLTEYF